MTLTPTLGLGCNNDSLDQLLVSCHLHWSQILPLVSTTWIATLRRIALLALSVSIELVSSSTRVTSVKFQLYQSLSDTQICRPIDRTPCIAESKKSKYCLVCISTNIDTDIDINIDKYFLLVPLLSTKILLLPRREGGSWQRNHSIFLSL